MYVDDAVVADAKLGEDPSIDPQGDLWGGEIGFSAFSK